MFDLPKLLSAIAVALLCGCSSCPKLTCCDKQKILDHIIAVDGKGFPHDPTDPNGPAESFCAYRQQLDHMFFEMQTFHDAHPGSKVLVFVHGGLNSPSDSLKFARAEMDPAMSAGYYPIYLDWNSGILDTYGDHILTITQGEEDTSVVRYLFSPFYVVADIGRALVRTPIVWANQLASDLQAVGTDFTSLSDSETLKKSTTEPSVARKSRWAQGVRGKALAETYLQLRALQDNDKNPTRRTAMRIYIGPDEDVNPAHLFGITAMYIITIPTKLVSEPIIDWLGTPAWQVMCRRTLIAFDGTSGGNPTTFPSGALRDRHDRKASNCDEDFSHVGAVEIFREYLEQVRGDLNSDDANRLYKGPQVEYDVTLVAHSAGSLVINEWLRRDLLEQRSKKYSHIVYLAAACTVRDFSRAVVPYLMESPDTQFYNLMLHPLAEVRERQRFYDLPPRGSLLVWLDEFLTEPQTPLDRTLGRWDNIISAAEVIPKSVRGQVTLRAFALAPYDSVQRPVGAENYGPQEHGQFRRAYGPRSGQPYWCSDFWTDQCPTVSDICAPACK
jgi:hypothetical protein